MCRAVWFQHCLPLGVVGQQRFLQLVEVMVVVVAVLHRGEVVHPCQVFSVYLNTTAVQLIIFSRG